MSLNPDLTMKLCHPHPVQHCTRAMQKKHITITLEATCLMSVSLFSREHWKQHDQIVCAQNKKHVCFLASIENYIPGFLVSKTIIKYVLLRALKTTCLVFLYSDQKSGLFSCEH